MTDTFAREYVYDRANRVEAVRPETNPTPIAEYDFNLASQRTQVDYASGHKIKYEYDSYGRLSLLANLTPSDATMSSFEYEYDLDGLRTKVTLEDDDYVNYGYDGLNRLTDEHKKDATGETVWRREYAYDKVGNRTERVRTDLVGGSPVSVTETLSYNGLGQLATMEWTESGTDYRNLYTYDANGNVATREEGWRLEAGGWEVEESRTYTWDVRDRLVKVEIKDATDDLVKRVDYEYCVSCGGGLKYRIEYDSSLNIVSWLRYEYEGLNLLRIDEVYDKDDDDVLEDPANGQDAWRPLNVYTHGPGAISQIIRNQTYYNGSPSTLIYYYYDALGNMLTYSYSSSGYGNFEMDAFGNSIPGSPGWPPITSNGPKAKLTGKMYDEDTGLYYFHARWYDSEVGRFVSRDKWSAYLSGEYSFCVGNPLNIYDPDGRFTRTDDGWFAEAECDPLSKACEANLQNAVELIFGRGKWEGGFQPTKKCQKRLRELWFDARTFRSDRNCKLREARKRDDGSLYITDWTKVSDVCRGTMCVRRFSTGEIVDEGPPPVVATVRYPFIFVDDEVCQDYSDEWVRGSHSITNLACIILHEIGHWHVETTMDDPLGEKAANAWAIKCFPCCRRYLEGKLEF